MAEMADPQIIRDLLEEAAQRFILPRFNLLQPHEISTKTGPNDLVTEADRDVEKFLMEKLPKIVRGSIVIGEEEVSAGRISLDQLKTEQGPVWIVDPVDGTYNFVHGKREFGILLGLLYKKETVQGWIYDVPKNRAAITEQGSGAFLDGVRINVSDCRTAADAHGFIGKTYFPQSMRDHFEARRGKVKKFESLRCAAHEYLRLVTGQADFAISSRVKPWDHVAGELMMREAGGVAGKWDGAPYRASQDGGGLMVAASQNLWDEIYEIFVKKFVEDNYPTN